MTVLLLSGRTRTPRALNPRPEILSLINPKRTRNRASLPVFGHRSFATLWVSEVSGMTLVALHTGAKGLRICRFGVLGLV